MDTNNPNPQEPQGNAGTDANKPNTTPENNNASENNAKTADHNLVEIRKAKEASDKRASDLEAKLKAREEDDLKKAGKTEELLALKNKELEDVKSQFIGTKSEIALRDALNTAGINPKHLTLAKLALQEKGVKYNAESGQLEGAIEAIKSLQTDYPEFFGVTTPAGTVGTSSAGAGSTAAGKTFTGSELNKLSPAEYQAQHKEIQEAIKSNKVDWEK